MYISQIYFKSVLIVALIMSLNSCSKDEKKDTEQATNQFKTYKITKGQHYSDNAAYKPLSGLKSMSFTVVFDSTAKYYTSNPQNQLDINKLYGFSDNNQTHHAFSARIGWRWSYDKLELLGYVYNDSIVQYTAIGFFPINTELPCKIEVAGNKYLFTISNSNVELPRRATGLTATGYQLYPYFGGDETAPHDIYIRIKEN